MVCFFEVDVGKDVDLSCLEVVVPYHNNRFSTPANFISKMYFWQFCTNEHRCVCSCGWFGTACQFNESTSDDVITSHNSTNQSQSWCLPKENPPEVTQLFSTTLEESTSKPIGAGATENEEGTLSLWLYWHEMFSNV